MRYVHERNRQWGKLGNCYNIASGKYISINDLAKLMISISGKDLKVGYEKPKEEEIKHSQTTINLARKEFEYLGYL